jgi:hypothetical protein
VTISPKKTFSGAHVRIIEEKVEQFERRIDEEYSKLILQKLLEAKKRRLTLSIKNCSQNGVRRSE